MAQQNILENASNMVAGIAMRTFRDFSQFFDHYLQIA
jgi:hypothetical protein